MLTIGKPSPKYTLPPDKNTGAKLLEIMTETLQESWGIILLVDHPMDYMKTTFEKLENRWKNQARSIQAFLVASFDERGIARWVPDDYLDNLTVLVEFLTEELRFQSELLIDAVRQIENLPDAEVYTIGELQIYLESTHIALVNRIGYVGAELRRLYGRAELAPIDGREVVA